MIRLTTEAFKHTLTEKKGLVSGHLPLELERRQVAKRVAGREGQGKKERERECEFTCKAIRSASRPKRNAAFLAAAAKLLCLKASSL